MGSDSDLEAMKKCLQRLDEFEIPCEVRIISAHRTPQIAEEYASSAIERGLKVIIAAAGMSAALSGVLAASTTIPVIGVPMCSGPLVGVDAALSTMQMPPGIPVGCMAIGSAGGANCGRELRCGRIRGFGAIIEGKGRLFLLSAGRLSC